MKLPKLFSDIAALHHRESMQVEATIVGLVMVPCRAADSIDFSAVRAHRPSELQEILRVLPGSAASHINLDHDQLASMLETKIKSAE